MPHRSTAKIVSSHFSVRRDGDVMIIENVAPDLDEPDFFADAFEQALERPSKGIVVHLPRPKSVTSLFIDALGGAALDAADAQRPLYVVAHPKVRVLISMFDLEHRIPVMDRLQTAIETLSGGK